MSQSWGPTAAGKLFTGAPYWRLVLEEELFTLTVRGGSKTGSVLSLEEMTVKPGGFWAEVHFFTQNGNSLNLDGIPNDEAENLRHTISSVIEKIKYRERIQILHKDFDQLAPVAISWVKAAIHASEVQLRTKGWLRTEFVQRQRKSKPTGLVNLLKNPEIVAHIQNQPTEIQTGLQFWSQEFSVFANVSNENHLKKQLVDNKAFFDSVEKSPLTQEQSKAVVCFDSRVLLVASAGSGKTSTMVAKAGYALKNGYFEADRMLLLAFNNDAAAELRQRIKERLGPLGLTADKVVAKTFHAFGLDVIGLSTGKRPTLAPWVESGRDLEKLLSIVDDLKDRDLGFRASWDLFRVVFGQDLPKFGKEADSPDSWDRSTRKEGFWTFNNEVVKSRGEQLIANWLFYNGVRYVYEGPYEVDTADPQHRQYRPDFYFPDANAYLEHWALNADGEPPLDFVGYKEGMAWKKFVHAANGTKLLETTVAGLWSGQAFEYLETHLQELGVALDPNPDRPTSGRTPIENPRLARTFRSFMTHAKSNRLDLADMKKRLHSGVAGDFQFRHVMFLGLFEKVWAEWELQLTSKKFIDFEDMLNLATDCVEQGKWKSSYELVMVDEFQDASHARARLVAGLVNGSEKCLFAVGDDWQSINRFAGADLAVMTDFERRFGSTVTLKLETTFRCPQSLCDISSTFVQKNPKQLRKAVRSTKPNLTDPIHIIRVDDEREIKSAVKMRLNELSLEAVTTGRKAKVLLLGRYQKDRAYLPEGNSALDLDFITVHASKGLEADHIILPRMTSETLGFPSRIADDPVLLLAMPGGDLFEYAEERRLLYVAMTRARATVTLITIAHKESPFITELVREHQISVQTADGTEDSRELCPVCREGFMVTRKGKYGDFLGCTNYPKCKNTRNIDEVLNRPSPRTRTHA